MVVLDDDTKPGAEKSVQNVRGIIHLPTTRTIISKEVVRSLYTIPLYYVVLTVTHLVLLVSRIARYWRKRIEPPLRAKTYFQNFEES